MQLRQVFANMTTREIEGLHSYLTDAKRLLSSGINKKTEIEKMITSEDYRQICYIAHAAFLELGQRELNQ